MLRLTRKQQKTPRPSKSVIKSEIWQLQTHLHLCPKNNNILFEKLTGKKIIDSNAFRKISTMPVKKIRKMLFTSKSAYLWEIPKASKKLWFLVGNIHHVQLRAQDSWAAAQLSITFSIIRTQIIKHESTRINLLKISNGGGDPPISISIPKRLYGTNS